MYTVYVERIYSIRKIDQQLLGIAAGVVKF